MYQFVAYMTVSDIMWSPPRTLYPRGGTTWVCRCWAPLCRLYSLNWSKCHMQLLGRWCSGVRLDSSPKAHNVIHFTPSAHILTPSHPHRLPCVPTHFARSPIPVLVVHCSIFLLTMHLSSRLSKRRKRSFCRSCYLDITWWERERDSGKLKIDGVCEKDRKLILPV